MRFSVAKLTTMAAMTAAALIMFVIEAQIPLPFPIPGVKLGLANSVTLFALFYGSGRAEPKTLTTMDAFVILMCRIALGAVFTGRIVAFAFSLSGGLLGFAAQAVLRRFVSNKQIWACGAVGAVFHNIGQIIAAIALTGAPSIVSYLPWLIAAGIATGVITGMAAQITLHRIRV